MREQRVISLRWNPILFKGLRQMHHYWLYYGLFLSLLLFSSPLLAKMNSAFDGGEPESEGISLISTSEIKADTFSLSFQDVSSG